MACPNVIYPTTCVPVCGSVLCETPGVIYVSVDPEIWKLRCQECQTKPQQRCALKKLERRYRGNPSKRRKSRTPERKKSVQIAKSKDEKKSKDNSKARDDSKTRKDPKSGEEGKGKAETKGDSKGPTNSNTKEGHSSKTAHDDKSKMKSETDLELMPPEPIPDDHCACADRPTDIPSRPNVCHCKIYRPLNFKFELQVTGESKPAYVPKPKKGKE